MAIHPLVAEIGTRHGNRKSYWQITILKWTDHNTTVFL